MLDIYKPSMDEDDKRESYVLSEYEKPSSAYQELGYKLIKLIKLSHIDHVNTRKFSRHLALEEMYTQLPNLIDPYLEMVVIHYGEIPCSTADLMDSDPGNSSDKLDRCFDNVYECIEELADETDSVCMETALGDIQKFLAVIRYKLERF